MKISLKGIVSVSFVLCIAFLASSDFWLFFSFQILQGFQCVLWLANPASLFSNGLMKGLGPIVFDAILTSGQTRDKLQCLYESLMSNNFRRTAVLKKISIVN